MSTEPGHTGDTPGEPSSPEDAFAQYLALRENARAAGVAGPDFEIWVQNYPQFEGALRQLESDWHGFDVLLKGALNVGAPETLFHRTPQVGSPPQSFMEFSPGLCIGDFRLVQRIGQGGMGEVWQAEQVSLKRDVALKFIRPDRMSERAQAYFDREARAGGRLNHPGIVAVHATGREGELNWIAQELVPGSSTIKDFLRAAETWARLPNDYFDRAVRFTAELCDALQVAHEADVIHRDVKPQNILVTPEDRPKLTDFGLARLTDEAAFSGSYAVKGTPIYMSPEQVLGKSKLIDHRTDIYSTGAVLFELLTLRRPFEGESSEVLKRILDSDPPDPCTIRPEVPPELGAIALKALERRPVDRYSTSAEMAADLRRYLAHEPVLARPPGPLQRTAKWARRHPTSTSVALLGLLLVATTWMLGGRASDALAHSAEARKDAILARTLRAIDIGDMEAAWTEMRPFHGEFPNDPRGHLVMAAGYARNLLVTDMEAELAKVAARDDWEDYSLAEDDSGMEQFLHGLRLLATGERRDYPQVLERFESPGKLDPDLEVVLYPLYQIRKALGNGAGALEALNAYRGTLRTSDPVVRLVDALRLELDIDAAAGADEARRLLDEVGEEEFSRLRGFRTLGRMELRAHEADPDGHFERLRAAEAALARAVEDVPEDFGAWANLAKAHLRLRDRTLSPEQRSEHLDRALACAEQSLSHDPTELGALQVRVLVHLQRLGKADASNSAQSLEDLRASMETLAEYFPGDGVLENAQSWLLFREGSAAMAAGQHDRAYELFGQSKQHELQLRARVMFAEIEFMRGRQREALELFLEAEALWEELDRRGAGEDLTWLFTIRVWAFGSADHAGEVNLAFEYRERCHEMVREELGVQTPEAFTLAEFLAIPRHAELRDCELSHQLLDTYPIETTLGSVPAHAETLAKMKTACPR